MGNTTALTAQEQVERLIDIHPSQRTARETALLALELGFSPVAPVEDGSKRPLADIAVSDPKDPTKPTAWTWENYQDTPATPQHVKGWFKGDRQSIGLATGYGGLECLEFDDAEAFNRFITEAEDVGLGELVSRVRGGYEETTPSGGIHWLLRSDNPDGNQKLARDAAKKTLIETRGVGGFVIIAPSRGPVHPSGGAYTLRSGGLEDIACLTPDERQALLDFARTFDETPEPQSPRPRPTSDRGRTDANFEKRVVAYVEKIEPAISGQSGHDKAFYAACRVGPGFDLTPDQTYAALQSWNQRCEPPWSEKELRHKINDAFAKEAQRGWLRNAPPPEGKAARSKGRGDSPPKLKVVRPSEGGASCITNFSQEIQPNVLGDPMPVKVAKSPTQVIQSVINITKGWPKVVGTDLVAKDSEDRPIILGSATRLFGFLHHQADIEWEVGPTMMSQERFFESCRMPMRGGFDAYDSMERLPHYPERPRTLYIHPPAVTSSGPDLLDQFISFFTPESLTDRELLRAAVMTPLWGGEPGRRPAFLIEGPEDDEKMQGRGVGKTTVATLIGYLLSGHIELRPSEDFGTFITRYLSDDGGQRVVLIDNLKSLRFSWADLEGFVTGTTISGRRLYRGEGRVPNTTTCFITVNSAQLSKDLAVRVIPVRLGRPKYRPEWEDEVRAFIDANRWQLIASIGSILLSKPEPIVAATRWASWEQSVLAHCDEIDRCQDTIKRRCELIDDDDNEAAEIRNHFARELIARRHRPDEEKIFIPSEVAAEWLSAYEKKPLKVPTATSLLQARGVPGLTYKRSRDSRGWVWVGTDLEAKITPLNRPDW